MRIPSARGGSPGLSGKMYLSKRKRSSVLGRFHALHSRSSRSNSVGIRVIASAMSSSVIIRLSAPCRVSCACAQAEARALWSGRSQGRGAAPLGRQKGHMVDMHDPGEPRAIMTKENSKKIMVPRGGTLLFFKINELAKKG